MFAPESVLPCGSLSQQSPELGHSAIQAAPEWFLEGARVIGAARATLRINGQKKPVMLKVDVPAWREVWRSRR
jgi:hypothetical protein